MRKGVRPGGSAEKSGWKGPVPPAEGDLAPSGFEPLSPAPKAGMLGRYTTGLRYGRVPRTKEGIAGRWVAQEATTDRIPCGTSRGGSLILRAMLIHRGRFSITWVATDSH